MKTYEKSISHSIEMMSDKSDLIKRGRGRPRKVVEAVAADLINHPAHYTSHPSGVECIEITEHMTFCLGNAMKYIWRAGIKSTSEMEDLRKAQWYVTREIDRLGPKK